MIIDTFNTKKILEINSEKYIYFDLNVLESVFKFDLKAVPLTLKILLENLIRNEDGKIITSKLISDFCKKLNKPEDQLEIFFYPTRVLMQDFTGVPAIADLAAMRDALQQKNIEPRKINPLSRVDLIIDHSVMVDSFGKSKSYQENVAKEFLRNKERYEFLKWGQNTFDNFHLVPPGAGICHQVNLENIAQTIWIKKTEDEKIIFPDSVIGTDSHTTMINGLSVLGWGVGGIEAEAAMLGEPISMNVPEVVGFEIHGLLKDGVTATDLVLTITEKLRSHNVVGKFIEFYGEGLNNLTLADRATISNMAPEYGATCSFFPTDGETINYLDLTGKDEHHLEIVTTYTKIQKLWRSDNKKNFNETIKFNLNEVESSIAGPKRPQDKIFLRDVPISLTGESPGVRMNRGVLSQGIQFLSVECLPLETPERIEIDISVLEEIDSSIRVKDYSPPSGIKVLSDAEDLIARVSAPRAARTARGSDADDGSVDLSGEAVPATETEAPQE